MVIANGENSAGGSGITSRIANEIFSLGVDVITLGDHTWDKSDIVEYLKQNANIIRPANFPEGTPGKGWTVFTTSKGVKVAVINLLGRVFMRYNVDCPFRALQKIVEEASRQTPNIILDMHAETTSEKVAMGHFCDGKISAVFGTHTHIQTADEKILPQKTAYITDLGMTGPYDSVIGQNKEIILERYWTILPKKFEVAESEATLCGVVIDLDEKTGRARGIQRIQRN